MDFSGQGMFAEVGVKLSVASLNFFTKRIFDDECFNSITSQMNAHT